MGRYSSSYWPPYVPVAERRRRATKKVEAMKKSGYDISPVEITGREIATTFWGAAWCTNLKAYSDYSNRLPRGKTYVRNGSVLDLQIEQCSVSALVSGTEEYRVEIKIKPLSEVKWNKIKRKCAGQIVSLVELLQGSLSKGVMGIVTRKGEGLFPSPREIDFSCSCPDWATMCKHVAATLYGVGARLDQQPELLFTLRNLDPAELVEAAIDQPKTAGKSGKGRVLKTNELSSVFGIDIEAEEPPSEGKPPSGKVPRVAKGAAKTDTPSSPKVAKGRKVSGAVSKGAKVSKKTPAKKKNPPRKTSTGKTTSGRRTSKGGGSSKKPSEKEA